MQRNQWILAGFGLILTLSVYFWAVRKNPNKPQPATQAASHEQSANSVPELDFEVYKKEQISQLISDQRQQAEELDHAVKQQNTPESCRDAAEFWEKMKNLNLAAHYYQKGAFLENTEKSVTFAGNLFLAVMQRTDQPELRKWQATEAIACFNRALEINPDNTESKIALATCYTEGTGETMKGVTLLREITEKDSNHISANIILGKLAIQSGQLDKAVRRLERVLSLRPENTEAMYFLAEAYKNQGNHEKAITLFEQCKKLVNNPDFSKEIDQYIQTFKH